MFTSLQIFCYILHYQLLVKSLVSQSYMRKYFLGLILSFSPFPGNAPCERGKFKILCSYFFHDNLSYWLSEWISSNPFTLISVFPCSSPSFASPQCLFPFGNVLTRTTCNIHHDWATEKVAQQDGPVSLLEDGQNPPAHHPGQPALGDRAVWPHCMTPTGPFQSQSFCDSVILTEQKVANSPVVWNIFCIVYQIILY